MKQVAAAIQAMDQQQITSLERTGAIDLTPDRRHCGPRHSRHRGDILRRHTRWLVANEGTMTVVSDVTVTPALRREGMARELVNRIQNIRKGRDYNITDHIKRDRSLRCLKSPKLSGNTRTT